MDKLFSIRVQLAAGVMLVAVGLGLLWLRMDNEATNVVPPPAKTVVWQTQKSVISGEPERLSIPSLKMSLQVIDGYYNARTGEWTLTLDKVQYATITPPPNDDSGSTFLYGHYRPEVFAYLHLIKPGAEAIIQTTNGHVFTYEFISSRVVSPDDTNSAFNYQGPPILTVQTCTGLFFQNRQLFTFKLVKVV